MSEERINDGLINNENEIHLVASLMCGAPSNHSTVDQFVSVTTVQW